MKHVANLRHYQEYVQLNIENQERAIAMAKEMLEWRDSSIELLMLETALFTKQKEMSRCKYIDILGHANIEINADAISPDDFYHWYIKTKTK